MGVGWGGVGGAVGGLPSQPWTNRQSNASGGGHVSCYLKKKGNSDKFNYKGLGGGWVVTKKKGQNELGVMSNFKFHRLAEPVDSRLNSEGLPKNSV